MIAIKLYKDGFTLVELSIVIIIVGLLISGITAGSSLIKQAKLHAIVTEMDNLQLAYNQFVLIYSAVPGDMVNASSYWPSTCTVSGIPGECNGDGDGIIQGGDYTSLEEMVQSTKHLELAGLINEKLALVPQFFQTDLIPGVNAPSSKLDGAGYMFNGSGVAISGVGIFRDDTGGLYDGFSNFDHNYLYLGKPGLVRSLTNGALSPQDAFSIDAKIDDGSASNSGLIGALTGKVKSKDEYSGGSTHECAVGNVYSVAIDRTYCLFGKQVD